MAPSPAPALQKLFGFLDAPISPPPSKRSKRSPPETGEPARYPQSWDHQLSNGPTTSQAAIEAGEVLIKDHLKFFSEQLQQVVKGGPGPRLSIEGFADLYQRNQHRRGRHFVLHQHDHPVAGLHYDLRLQISETSSISFAVMYGLPGNPYSRRLSRNTTETRAHNLWVRKAVAFHIVCCSLCLQIRVINDWTLLRPLNAPSRRSQANVTIESSYRDCYSFYWQHAYLGHRGILYTTLQEAG